jgi:3D (Asp-Asp-Asp) domain-containing protein
MKNILFTFLITLSVTVGVMYFAYDGELKIAQETVSNLQQENENKSAEIAKLEDVIENRDSKIKKYEEMLGEYSRTNERLNGKVQQLQEELDKYDSLRKLNIVATAYTALCNTGCTGVTATGHNVKSTVYKDGYRVVSVDPNLIPLGSLMYVETNGENFVGIAEDTGGAIDGHRIDVLVKNKTKAFAFGKQSVKVTVLREGRG